MHMFSPKRHRTVLLEMCHVCVLQCVVSKKNMLLSHNIHQTIHHDDDTTKRSCCQGTQRDGMCYHGSTFPTTSWRIVLYSMVDIPSSSFLVI
jgi:hypothetical protein